MALRQVMPVPCWHRVIAPLGQSLVEVWLAP
jgi:hypothetical protein